MNDIQSRSPDASREPSFTPSGFFVLRTPLLPFEELGRWGDGLEAAQHAPTSCGFEPALQRDRDTVRLRLRELVRKPEVREALFVASPGFCEHLSHWERTPESERGEKLERGLMRYVTRMVGRPTPFGLFAGYSVGELGERTRLRTGPRSGYQRHTRLDMDYACLLAESLSRSPELRPHIPHRPSTSLYRATGRLRYAEGRLHSRNRSYHLVAVEPSDYLEAMIARARSGARPEELARALVEMDPEISPEEAAAFIEELDPESNSRIRAGPSGDGRRGPARAHRPVEAPAPRPPPGRDAGRGAVLARAPGPRGTRGQPGALPGGGAHPPAAARPGGAAPALPGGPGQARARGGAGPRGVARAGARRARAPPHRPLAPAGRVGPVPRGLHPALRGPRGAPARGAGRGVGRALHALARAGRRGRPAAGGPRAGRWR